MAPAPKCILVVEDELLIRMILGDLLRDAGYDVIEAVNADEALIVLQSAARVDMILSDVRMPGSMDGIGLLRVVRNAYPKIPIIITSAHLQPALATIGGARFIAKPYQLELILKAVAEELGGENDR